MVEMSQAGRESFNNKRRKLLSTPTLVRYAAVEHDNRDVTQQPFQRSSVASEAVDRTERTTWMNDHVKLTVRPCGSREIASVEKSFQDYEDIVKRNKQIFQTIVAKGGNAETNSYQTPDPSASYVTERCKAAEGDGSSHGANHFKGFKRTKGSPNLEVNYKGNFIFLGPARLIPLPLLSITLIIGVLI